jgi:GAF domain-containing protein
MKLAKDVGFCWCRINQEKTIIVDDIAEFPGCIACDSRSQSQLEIVIPVKNKKNEILGIIDVDAKVKLAFDEIDTEELSKIVELIYN